MSLSIPTGLSSPFRLMESVLGLQFLSIFQSQPGCHLHFDYSRGYFCTRCWRTFNPNRAVISISTISAYTLYTCLETSFNPNRAVISISTDDVGLLLISRRGFQSQPGCHLHFDSSISSAVNGFCPLSIPTGLSSPFRPESRNEETSA